MKEMIMNAIIKSEMIIILLILFGCSDKFTKEKINFCYYLINNSDKIASILDTSKWNCDKKSFIYQTNDTNLIKAKNYKYDIILDTTTKNSSHEENNYFHGVDYFNDIYLKNVKITDEKIHFKFVMINNIWCIYSFRYIAGPQVLSTP